MIMSNAESQQQFAGEFKGRAASGPQQGLLATAAMPLDTDFPAEEFEIRRSLLLAAMDEKGLSCLLAIHPSSIHWLTGCQTKGYQAFQCVIVERRPVRFTLFIRESEKYEALDTAFCDDVVCWGSQGQEDPIERLMEMMRAKGLAGTGQGAMEVPAYYLHPHHYVRLKSELTFGDTPRLVHDLRLVKSAREIAYLREAARIADLCLVAASQHLKAGASEREAAAALHATAFRNGADVPTVPINLVSGPRAAYSHGSPSSRLLSTGDTGNVEFCIPYRRYTVSLGRQFSVGPADAEVLALHAVVVQAAAACIAQIGHGAPVRDSFMAAESVLFNAGYADDRAHTMGYVIAPAFAPATGEQFHLSAASKDVFRAGMNLSICPNIYIGDRRIGVRIVDNVLVTETGAERLSTLAPDRFLYG